MLAGLSGSAALLLWVLLLISPFSTNTHGAISVTLLAIVSTVYASVAAIGFVVSVLVDFQILQTFSDATKGYRFGFIGYQLYSLLSGTVLVVSFWSLYVAAGNGGGWALLDPPSSISPAQAVLAQVVGGVAIVFTTIAVYMVMTKIIKYLYDPEIMQLGFLFSMTRKQEGNRFAPLMTPNSQRFQQQRR